MAASVLVASPCEARGLGGRYPQWAVAINAAIATNRGASLSRAEKTTIGHIVYRLESNGQGRSTWGRLYIFMAADEAASEVDWANPGSNTLSPQNACIFTSNLGWTGDNASCSMTGMGNWSATGISQDNADVVIFSSGPTSGQNSGVIGLSNNTGNFLLKASNDSLSIASRFNAVANVGCGNAVTGAGVTAWDRSDALTIRCYKNGSVISESSVSAAPDATPMAFLGGVGPANSKIYSADTVYAIGIRPSTGQTDQTKTVTALNAIAQDLGVEIANEQNGPLDGPNGLLQSYIANVRPAGLRVHQPSDCPSQNNDPSFAAYVVSDARSHIGSCATTPWTPPASGGGVIVDLWTYRCNGAGCGDNTPNTILGQPQADPAQVTCTNVDSSTYCTLRIKYTTIPQAHAASLATIDWIKCGTHQTTYSNGWRGSSAMPVYANNAALIAAVNAGTLPTTPWSRSGTAPYQFLTVTDVVVDPPAQACNWANDSLNEHVLELDQEMNHNESEASLIQFNTDVVTLLQNTAEGGYAWTLNIEADELQGGNAQGTGFATCVELSCTSTVFPALFALPGFGYFKTMLWSQNRYGSVAASWAAQMAVEGVSPCDAKARNHVALRFQIPNTTLADALTANALLSSWCVGVVQPWYNAVSPGGPNFDPDGNPVRYPQQLWTLVGLHCTISGCT